ncbi:MAG: hypothetical protein OXF02_02415 [Simkaniaceae bacterium]|nr:hypothetical protein [Simkaniaceae bacterium]
MGISRIDSAKGLDIEDAGVIRNQPVAQVAGRVNGFCMENSSVERAIACKIAVPSVTTHGVGCVAGGTYTANTHKEQVSTVTTAGMATGGLGSVILAGATSLGALACGIAALRRFCP